MYLLSLILDVVCERYLWELENKLKNHQNTEGIILGISLILKI